MTLITTYIIAAIGPAALLMYYVYKKDTVEKEPLDLLGKLILGGCAAGVLSGILEQGGMILLAAIWAAAVIGIFIKLFYVYCPKYVSSIIYVSMGWMALTKIVPIYRALGQRGFFWLLTGGLLYSIGAIIYALKIKISDSWSEHEVFHIFVLLGSICHFIMIFFYVI